MVEDAPTARGKTAAVLTRLRLRKEQATGSKMGQSELARQLGISQPYVSKIERGLADFENMPLAMVQRLGAVLGFELSDWPDILAGKMPGQSPPQRHPPLRHRIPDELQEAIDVYGARFPDLLDPAWQNYLASFRNLGIEADTAEDWFEWYRELARRKVKPGELN